METKIIYRRPLGNPARKWKQDNFVISTFKANARDAANPRVSIQEAKNLGFNLVEFGWTDPKDSYKCIVACEEVGIDGIFQNWDAFGGFQTSEGSMEVNKEAIQKFIDFTKKYRNVAGYYVWDEPIGKERLIAAGKQVDAIEEVDPERHGFTVALPSYNTLATWENGKYIDYIRDFARIIRPAVLSMDFYPFKQYRLPEPPDQLDSSNIYLDLGVIRMVAKENNMPMWFYFQSQGNPHTYEYNDFTPAQMRSQQYLSLLYGAKGLQNYNIFCGALNWDGTPGPLYHETQALNRYCTNWGRTLMALESKAVYHSPEVLKGNENFAALHNTTAESEILAEQDLPFRCSIGELADEEGNRYLIIQNRDYRETRTFRLELKKNFRIYEVSKFTGDQKPLTKPVATLDGNFTQADDLKNEISVNLGAGDAIFFRFQDAEQEPFLIDYVLQK